MNHLGEEIDRSFGDGPPAGPVDELVARGRRVVARRRLIASVGAASLVTVILGGSALATGQVHAGTGPTREFASRPGGTATASATPAPPPATATPSRVQIRRALQRPLASYDERGRLLLDPDARVVRRIEDPYRLTGPGRSVALELTYRGATYWCALHHAPDGTSGSAATWAGGSSEGFDAWVAEQRGMAEPPSAPGSSGEWPGRDDLQLVRFAGSGSLLLGIDGARVLQQRTPVSVGSSFAARTDRSVAAEVETYDGSRYYVLARWPRGGDPQYIAVAQSDGGRTLDDFLALARARYADGQGGLL